MNRKFSVRLPIVVVILCVGFITAAGKDGITKLGDNSIRAIYFSPTRSFLLLSAEDIERENLLVVTSSAELKTAVAINQSIEVIYFHPDAMNKIDYGWLQQQYDNGLLIAALNTPISFLATQLALEEVEVDDLKMDESFGRIGVTALRLWDIPGALEGYAYFSEFLPDFQTISLIVNKHFIDINPLHPKALQELSLSNNKNGNLMGTGNWWDCCGGRLHGITVPNSYYSGGYTFHTGAGFSVYNPAPSTADVIHVYLINSNDCGGWHTLFQGGFTALNNNQVWSDYQLVGSNQCPDPINPNQVTGKIHGSTHYVQEYNPVSGSTVEWVIIPLN